MSRFQNRVALYSLAAKAASRHRYFIGGYWRPARRGDIWPQQSMIAEGVAAPAANVLAITMRSIVTCATYRAFELTAPRQRVPVIAC